MENAKKKHTAFMSQKTKNVLLIVSLCLNVIAITAIAALLTRQSNQGLTLREITGVKDSQVTKVKVHNNGDSPVECIITDRVRINEFLDIFFDHYRMTAASDDGDWIGENDGLTVMLYQGNDLFLYFNLAHINPLGIDFCALQKGESYSLVDKDGFIRQINSFMKSVDRKWVDYN